ncbi:unnamed protein product [Lasius platythorax]|uniref:Uncharacterized protein n=1 Tax=Lasius platythorax TaxID=488582 RepID=A0AAV2NFA9_9HYME
MMRNGLAGVMCFVRNSKKMSPLGCSRFFLKPQPVDITRVIPTQLPLRKVAGQLSLFPLCNIAFFARHRQEVGYSEENALP